MATEIWVNIGSGNDLLTDDTKPLPGPMLTDHDWSSVIFMLEQFHIDESTNKMSLSTVNALVVVVNALSPELATPTLDFQ